MDIIIEILKDKMFYRHHRIIIHFQNKFLLQLQPLDLVPHPLLHPEDFYIIRINNQMYLALFNKFYISIQHIMNKQLKKKMNHVLYQSQKHL